MTTQEKRFVRRELINYHLQHCHVNSYRLRAIMFLVRNSEIYHYGQELKVYSK